MRKNKLLIGILLAGLLLVGIGGGILCAEFLNLNYGGEYICQTDHPETQTFDLSLEKYPEGPVYVACYSPQLFPLEDRLIIDEAMPEGTVRIKTVYDQESVSPCMHIESQYWDSDMTHPETVLHMEYCSSQDDIALFFQMKDLILKDLKNGILCSYRTEDILDLTITAGPQTAARLSFNF